MSKRKTIIELQNKPENREVRKLVEKTKPVAYAPLDKPNSAAESATGAEKSDSSANSATQESAKNQIENVKKGDSARTDDGETEKKNSGARENAASKTDAEKGSLEKIEAGVRSSENFESKERRSLQDGRLRIFQASNPRNRAITQFQKAAIIVRGANGKETIELAWRDQMNEKTRDIWDYLVERFDRAEKLNTNEILIRKRDVLENSGVKSDRTFINAIYTLEDMALIRVRRLSGNKEGNVYILTDEGREEIDGYRKLES